MGKKKKTTTTVTEAVLTEVVKLTYLQTLAVSQNKLQTADLESGPTSKTGQIASSSSLSNEGVFGTAANVLGNNIFGTVVSLGKKKKSSTTQTVKTSGAKIKDTWLQPYFDKIAYKIGIKEFNVSKYTFYPASEFTSVPFSSFKEVVKATVLVDEFIPESFDKNINWIHYFVKVEGEDKWTRINPVNKPTIFNEEGNIIPKILNFNLPKPGTAQIEDKYQYTESPVKEIRFKAVLYRPEGDGLQSSMTPILKSYRLTLVPKS